MAQMILRWTPHALRALDEAYVYIQHENPMAADAVITRIEKAVSMLATFPNAGREGEYVGTRELVVTGTPFIIPYRVHKKVIEILAVVHHARIWPDGFGI